MDARNKENETPLQLVSSESTRFYLANAAELHILRRRQMLASMMAFQNSVGVNCLLYGVTVIGDVANLCLIRLGLPNSEVYARFKGK